LGTLSIVSKMNCHPDRSVAEWSDCLICQGDSWKRRQQAASENGERFPLSHEFGGVEAAC
jgi:hypothetical protein